VQEQTIDTIPDDYSDPPPFDFYTAPSHAAEVAASVCGRFVYVSNRGHDSLAVFSVDGTTGRLAKDGYHITGAGLPWHFELIEGTDLVLIRSVLRCNLLSL